MKSQDAYLVLNLLVLDSTTSYRHAHVLPFDFPHLLTSWADERITPDTVLLDRAKAFDRVAHSHLLTKGLRCH